MGKKNKQVIFADQEDHRIKIKEREKIDKYLDLTWELKRLWNKKVTEIQIVAGKLWIVTENLEKD